MAGVEEAPARPSPRQEAQRALGDLLVVLRDTTRKKVSSEDSEDEFEGYQLVMKRSDGEPDDITDMSRWQPLEDYIRKTLKLPGADKFQIKLFTQVRIGATAEVSLNVRDDTTLSCFRRALLRKGAAELRNINCVELSIKEFKPLKLNKKTEPRTGKRAEKEQHTKDLATLTYGEGRGMQREGVWSDDCNEYMARHPKELRDFFKMRAAVAKVCASCHNYAALQVDASRARPVGPGAASVRSEPEAMPVPVHQQEVQEGEGHG